MTCACGGPIHVSFDIVGGCSGHDADEYCYCDSPHLVIEYRCGAAKRCRNKNFNHLPSESDDIRRIFEKAIQNAKTAAELLS